MAVPRVSVLLPVRDGGSLLHAAVASILDQTLTDLELIVVDDHSRDGAIQALPPDRRLRLVFNPGRGIVAALNAAAAVARAPLLARMDSDDIALPERLARQLALLDTDPAIGIVGAQVEIFTDDGPPGGGYSHYQRWINRLTEPAALRREIFIESPIPHPTAVIRADVFKQLGGYRDTPWAEDYDLWLRAFAQGIAMAKPEAVLLRWRDSPRRLSRNDTRYGPAAFIDAKAYYLARTVLRHRPAIIWGAGQTGKALCTALDREGVEVQAFVDVDPKKIGRRKRGRPVLAVAQALQNNKPIGLGAVGSRGAREKIRALINQLGKTEGVDFWFVA